MGGCWIFTSWTLPLIIFIILAIKSFCSSRLISPRRSCSQTFFALVIISKLLSWDLRSTRVVLCSLRESIYSSLVDIHSLVAFTLPTLDFLLKFCWYSADLFSPISDISLIYFISLQKKLKPGFFSWHENREKFSQKKWSQSSHFMRSIWCRRLGTCMDLFIKYKNLLYSDFNHCNFLDFSHYTQNSYINFIK